MYLFINYDVCNDNSLSGGDANFTKTKFLEHMNFQDNRMVLRMFQIFDKNNDDIISFPEFMSFASILSSKTKQDRKIEFSFKVYDNNNDGFITADDLQVTLTCILRAHKLVATAEQIEEMVLTTIKDMNGVDAGKISFGEYADFLAKKPLLLSFLTVNISNIVMDFSKTTGMVFATPR